MWYLVTVVKRRLKDSYCRANFCSRIQAQCDITVNKKITVTFQHIFVEKTSCCVISYISYYMKFTCCRLYSGGECTTTRVCANPLGLIDILDASAFGPEQMWTREWWSQRSAALLGTLPLVVASFGGVEAGGESLRCDFVVVFVAVPVLLANCGGECGGVDGEPL
jgi:hypothetical protein